MPVTENGTAVKTASACLSDTDSIVYRSDPKTSYEYSITYSGYKENIAVSEYIGQTDYLAEGYYAAVDPEAAIAGHSGAVFTILGRAADGRVARVSSTGAEYGSLEEAFAYAGDVDTVELLKLIEESKAVDRRLYTE